MKKIIRLLLTVVLCILPANKVLSGEIIKSLAGPWRFALDPKDVGIVEKWYSKTFDESVLLPGSCEQRGYGFKTVKPAVGRLTRAIHYEGKAWYQRDFIVPKKWQDKRVELIFERCHWESDVWIDSKYFGMENSLCAPHVYDLGSLPPGKHTITVCVDNTYKIPIGTWSHAITEDTQGNWNGIIGRMELRVTDLVWIKNVQVFHDHLLIGVGNNTGKTIEGTIQHSLCNIPDGGTTIKLPFVSNGRLWDEFSPAMQKLTVTLKAGIYCDNMTVTYGNRELSTRNKQFTINERPFIMRGPVDECVYPLTGYPPMDEKAWIRVLSICRSYGFNFMRFHSWCPPEAAFAAADKLGFYFQVELPLWTMDAPAFGNDPKRDQFITDELYRILKTYGNHPSFALMAMGNESFGKLDELVQKGRAFDPRRLYRCEGGNTEKDGDYVEAGQRGVAGPRTNWDRWSAKGWIAGGNEKVNQSTGAPVPTLSHEIGQWDMYPDFGEIKKFTGTLRAYNFEEYRRSLEEHGMLDEDKNFATSSGKLSVLLYKSEIEANLRTYPYGGFEVLEARDYPGQGTAIVGWLDMFWDSKGLITPKEFRRFCGPTVTLLQMPKRVYFNNENFSALAEISNYGPKNLKANPCWTITDNGGHIVAKGSLPVNVAEIGKVTKLGDFSTSLRDVTKATRLTVNLEACGVSNSWHIWVYPEQQPTIPAGIKIAYNYDQDTRDALERGERVLLFSNPTEGLYKIYRTMNAPDSIRLFKVKPEQNALEGTFMPTFWNLRLFNQEGTLGILCDPNHPALKGFPTDSYSDWQWADLLGKYTSAESFLTAGAPASYCDAMEKAWGDVRNRSKAIVLNDTPDNFRPIVQVIDNYERNYKLGLIFETRVGKGKLLVCAMDLDTDSANRPAALQLKNSLMNYVAGNQFNPQFELSPDLLNKVLTFVDEK